MPAPQARSPHADHPARGGAGAEPTRQPVPGDEARGGTNRTGGRSPCRPSRCGSCSKPESTSATRPAAGTPRCARSSSRSATGSTSSTWPRPSQRLDVALEFVRETVARGELVLFVGTKKQAQEPIGEEAMRAGMPFVNKRWLGGMLTNFIDHQEAHGPARAARGAPGRRRLRADDQEGSREADRGDDQAPGHARRHAQDEARCPGAIFIVDPHRERIAVTEANKLEIPVIGTGDTNVDPDELDYIIPANDDAIRAIRLLCALVADAAIEGARERSARAATRARGRRGRWRCRSPRTRSPGASDELVAALAGGAALSFEPDVDEDDDLLPGDRAARVAERRGPKRPRPRPARRTSPPSSPARRPRRRDDDAAARPPDARRAGRDPVPIERRPPRGVRTTPPPPQERQNGYGGHLGGAGQGTARADRRRVHGLQEGARPNRTATSRRPPRCCASAASPRRPRRPAATPARA